REIRRAQLVGGTAARERDRRGPDPRRYAARGYPLLEERLAAHALGEALQGRRPLVQRPQDAVTDRDVVLDHVALGVPLLGKAHPVSAGDPQRPSGDLDLARLAHEPHPTRVLRPPAAGAWPCGRP